MTHPDHCVFCALYEGSIEASTVFRNEHVMAAMTIRPLHAGHVLLFPKAHVEDFALLDQAQLGYLFHVGARLKHLAAIWTRARANRPTAERGSDRIGLTIMPVRGGP